MTLSAEPFKQPIQKWIELMQYTSHSPFFLFCVQAQFQSKSWVVEVINREVKASGSFLSFGRAVPIGPCCSSKAGSCL
jgi:hypothetical protein